MLSRTADNLYWFARYIERADNTARILEAANRLTAMPIAYSGTSNEWESAVAATGHLNAFRAAYPDATADNVVSFLAFSTANPSSIKMCVETGRANARAVRTALTAVMWEAINGAWLDLRRVDGRDLRRSALDSFLSRVKEAALRLDGSAYRTMLRSEAYFFFRLGVMLERADNTARILEVKYHLLLPDSAAVGGSLDYFQWSSILRTVSAHTAYHWVYRQSLKPWLVADLLVLRPEMPRSLAACYDGIRETLDQLGQEYGRQGPAQRLARSIRTKLANAKIDDIFQGGLHEFLTEFIAENAKLGGAVAEQYLS
jgi:uncharacterized alpha-E superfamily protein